MDAKLVVTAMLCLASPLAAQARPDFSGAWTLSKERSRLQLPQAAAIERGVVRIVHRGSLFRFHRSFVESGQEDTLSWELKTDGAEVTSQEGAQRVISRLYWEGDTLVFITRFVAPRGAATNTVRYRLKDRGRALEATESFRGPRLSYDNLWVFVRSKQQ